MIGTPAVVRVRMRRKRPNSVGLTPFVTYVAFVAGVKVAKELYFGPEITFPLSYTL